ncbi:probable protein arginine N-methyltransferase 6 isoform X2 [Salvia miltiorrhiza]|uniref:probable protein arginine N-methyltransferase 6 isoform X2 n=1 Tax=Salvia miltiorrhiza TaxID=226208 RepID=UPI0025ACD7BE|nr:probable protein arginine N-methyltransferase 6 isoform X2 [Salvia miltiorrhiza]
MFQSTSGGNGSGVGAGVGDGAFHNGFLHGGVSDGAQLTRSRPRRGSRRRLHDQGPASEPRVSQQQEQHETERPPRPCTDFDVAYFNSYAHLGIHEEMIKVVLDVGCGTGILSIFCAQAGAKRVYAVDASNIAVQANEVIKANNLSGTVIVLHGRVEDVEIDEKVDVIVSEWMGYMLLYESMLGSVITARDRWLKPGGLILPSYATLYMAPVSYPERYSESVDFWRNVYGIDMSAMMPLAKQCAFEEPSVEMISGENVLTWPHVVKHVDCSTLTIDELETVSTRFTFKSMMRAPFHGFAFWFDVEFGGPSINTSKSNNAQPALVAAQDDTGTGTDNRKKRANPSEGLVLSTAPEAPPTHWQQTLIYFYDPIEVEQDQVIEGSVTLTQSKENARFMNVHLEYSSGGRSFVKESVMR